MLSNTNMDIRFIMVWAWMGWSSHALKQECYYSLGMNALVIARTKKERCHGLGMNALVIALTNMNVIMAWA